jgi:hypothetical protein
MWVQKYNRKAVAPNATALDAKNTSFSGFVG